MLLFQCGSPLTRVFVDQREITLADLLPKAADWLTVLRTVIQETEVAGSAKGGT